MAVEMNGAGLVRRRAGCNHQRQQVILVRLCVAGAWSGFPAAQRDVARLAFEHRRVKPRIERFGRGVYFPATEEAAYVVVCLAATEYQDAFAPQRLESTPDRKVSGRIEAALQRELNQRDVSVRHHHLEGHEDAVIPLSGRPGIVWDASGPKETAHARRQVGRTGSWPAQLIGVVGEAAVIEQQRRRRACIDGRDILLPMARDGEDGTRASRELWS